MKRRIGDGGSSSFALGRKKKSRRLWLAVARKSSLEVEPTDDFVVGIIYLSFFSDDCSSAMLPEPVFPIFLSLSVKIFSSCDISNFYLQPRPSKLT